LFNISILKRLFKHTSLNIYLTNVAVWSYQYFILVQKTATKAVVEMAENQSIGDGGFQLVILLAELHVPRMWVEQHPENRDSRV